MHRYSSDAAERVSFYVFNKKTDEWEANRIELDAIKFFNDGLKGRAYKEFQKLIEQAQKLDPSERQGYVDRAHRYMSMCEGAVERMNRDVPATRKRYAYKRRI